MSYYDTRHDHRAEHYHCADCNTELDDAADAPVARVYRHGGWETLCLECGEDYAREAAEDAYNRERDRNEFDGIVRDDMACPSDYIDLHGLFATQKCHGCPREVHIPHVRGVWPKGANWCSEHCRMRHYKGGPREQQRCRHCDEWFMPKSRKAKFCSPRCRGMNYRSRHPDYGTMEE